MRNSSWVTFLIHCLWVSDEVNFSGDCSQLPAPSSRNLSYSWRAPYPKVLPAPWAFLDESHLLQVPKLMLVNELVLSWHRSPTLVYMFWWSVCLVLFVAHMYNTLCLPLFFNIFDIPNCLLIGNDGCRMRHSSVYTIAVVHKVGPPNPQTISQTGPILLPWPLIREIIILIREHLFNYQSHALRNPEWIR